MITVVFPLKIKLLLGGAFDIQIRHSRGGHLNAILAQRGRNLNEPIFKNSNAQGFAPVGNVELSN